MAFWNDNYNTEFNLICDYVKLNLGNPETIPNDLVMVQDSKLVDAVVILAWGYFEKIFINRRDDLNKYTQFNQKHLEDRARPSIEELKENKLYFLSNLMRIVYEFYFWNQESYRTPSFISTQVLERLDRLNPSSDYKVQFLWIERSLPSAMIMDLMKSEEFETMRKMANDVNGYGEKINSHINEGIKAGEAKIEEYNTNIKALIDEAAQSKSDLRQYCDKLTEYKGDFNFVLLSKSFSNLLSTKKEELKKQHASLKVLFLF